MKYLFHDRGQGGFLRFVIDEWVLTAAMTGFILSSLAAGRLPVYSVGKIEILILLLGLFTAVKGLENSNLLKAVAVRLEGGGGFVPLKLVLATFFLAMVITNDAVLVVIVPLTMAMTIRHKGLLVVLEALAANAGSALTPPGNPQNLFIYWYYGVDPLRFMSAIAPFTGVFLIALALVAILVWGRCDPEASTANAGSVERIASGHGVMLLVVLLAVLRVLPAWCSLAAVLYSLALDRRSLRIDGILLLTLALFFGLAENLRLLLASRLDLSEHVFWVAALGSQLISNVPAALLLAPFTPHWQTLLWGVSVGGFGSLFGSLANLIAYRIYVTHPGTRDRKGFTVLFLGAGYAAFVLGAGLFMLLSG